MTESNELFQKLVLILEHLFTDSNYQMFKTHDNNGQVSIGFIGSFDITNSVPENFRSPYFKIDNIEQAEWLLLQVFGNNNSKDEFDEKLKNFLISHHIDKSKDLYISIFYSERI